MRAVKLSVEPFEFIHIVELESERGLNRHGVLRLTGLISQEKEKEYLRKAETETWVSVKAVSEQEEEKRFFVGILTGLRIRKENQVSFLTLELETGSCLLDLEPHIRSFQDAGFRYNDIIGICMEAAGGNYIMLEKQEEQPRKFFFQYRETDWEFLKRVASYAGIPLIPEDTVPGKNIYFGYRKEHIPDDFPADSYEMLQDYNGFRRQDAYGTGQAELKDAVSYRFRSREIYGLGRHLKFQGRDYVIGEIRSWLEGQELYHEYRMVTPKGGLQQVQYNEKLAGVSLKAEVTAVNKTMIQVRIQEDENKNGCGCRWFDYATVYSTPDGTGWYCMPEVGDTVRIIFPGREEGNAYAASAVHLGEAGGRSNPDEKSWKNRQEKEILFTPDSLCLRNNKGLLVELSDREGIRIVSDKNITVQSAGDLCIKSSGAGVRLSAANEIVMQQGAAKIQMDDAIYIGGGKIYMN